MNPSAIILIVTGGGALIMFGLLDLFMPSVAIRWQARSTEKARGARRAVGLYFQGRLGGDSTVAPSGNARLRRSVRLIGVVLIVYSTVVLAWGLVLLTRPG